MSEDRRAAALDAYVALLEGMSPERLGALTEHCAPDVRFQDPFNAVEGVERYRAVLEKMYEDVPEISFTVTHRALGEERAFIRWRFEGKTKGGGRLDFDGASELAFDEDGKITLHRDFWDAAGALYETVPVLGAVLRMIRKRLAID